MEIDAAALEKFRLRLRSKVRYHVGVACPDAEDLVHETLVRFIRMANEDKVRNRNNIGPFLNAVCNNVILEYRRRICREEPFEPEFHEKASAAPLELEIREEREAIDAALALLGDRDQAILTSFYLKDSTRTEVCDALGLTEPQFRVALFRAKQRFRSTYSECLKRRAPADH